MRNSYPLPETGFVRLANLLAPAGPIPVSKSTWWNGVKTGRFPKPIKLGPRITAAAESAMRAARSDLRKKAPSLYSMFFRPGQALLRSPVEPTVVEDAQKKLPPDACVIGYDSADGDVIGWTLTREHVSLEPLPISAETLATRVASVHNSCRQGTLAGDANLERLANALLDFAADQIESDQEWCEWKLLRLRGKLIGVALVQCVNDGHETYDQRRPVANIVAHETPVGVEQVRHILGDHTVMPGKTFNSISR